MYDVIVVGARCAGASAAMLLAREGYRVLLLDRARFPSDTLSTLYIHQPGVAHLERWRLLDAVRASGCPSLGHTIYETADVRLEGCALARDGITAAYAPRRRILDTILVEAAVAAGAELREGCTLVSLITDDRRVTGVRCRLASGGITQERGRLVVGADGMRSTVASLVGAETYLSHPRMTCVFYTYWSAVATDFELYERPGRWVAALSTHDDLTLVAVYYPQEEFRLIRLDAANAYLNAIRTTSPALYERLIAGAQADRLYGTGDQQNFFRRACGPGWVLLGDAGHHKDSINAQGITDAFWQAELLAGYLTDESCHDLDDETRLTSRLERFARERDRHLDLPYQTTLMRARLDVPPERLQFLRFVQNSPALVERYFGLVAGVLSPNEFYTRELFSLLEDTADEPVPKTAI